MDILLIIIEYDSIDKCNRHIDQSDRSQDDQESSWWTLIDIINDPKEKERRREVFDMIYVSHFETVLEHFFYRCQSNTNGVAFTE